MTEQEATTTKSNRASRPFESQFSYINTRDEDPTLFQWLLGMFTTCIFTFTFFLTPFYLIVAIVMLFWKPTSITTMVLWTILSISIMTPPIASPFAIRMLQPMLHYFDFERIVETAPVDVRQNMINGTTYICPFQPHGVISFCAICGILCNFEEEYQFAGRFKTAVASVLLYIPFIKNLMGIFGLVDASKESMRRHLKGKGIDGSLSIYVGGMAELFLSSRDEERLYLANRKGFIKLALVEGVDIVPIYLFGNTSILSVVQTGLLANLSRRLQVSLTYFWGKWGLPIPRDEKLLYASGQPIGITKIDNPTQEDIDKFHGKYLEEVKRLFNKHKHRLPAYKDKTLIIV